MAKSLEALRHDPFNLDTKNSWHGRRVSIDQTPTDDYSKEDVASVLYHGLSGDEWDGKESAIIELMDGRLIGFETYYGPTGDGFSEDAYGGDADVYFAKKENLSALVLEFTDGARELMGISKEGL